ncbi:MAG: hypothetical protein CMH22_05720 [Methylophaga sp.]|nr:hypothetical protein [Methylophaga sp.]|tara:strand:+ start:94539 stop:95087 length:549 start_codon:yes stop_codon:yes gene_type:complete
MSIKSTGNRYGGIIDVEKTTPIIYDLWMNILQRCYRHKNYKNCIVSIDWLRISNFSRWFEENYKPEYMEGWHLDKDILAKGNTVYDSKFCCFVPQEINKIFGNKKKSKYFKGVVKVNKKYRATINIGYTQTHLGYFKTPEEAFQAYKKAKEKHIKEVADKWKDKIDDRVYKAMYNWEVEITD